MQNLLSTTEWTASIEGATVTLVNRIYFTSFTLTDAECTFFLQDLEKATNDAQQNALCSLYEARSYEGVELHARQLDDKPFDQDEVHQSAYTR